MRSLATSSAQYAGPSASASTAVSAGGVDSGSGMRGVFVQRDVAGVWLLLLGAMAGVLAVAL